MIDAPTPPTKWPWLTLLLLLLLGSVLRYSCIFSPSETAGGSIHKIGLRAAFKYKEKKGVNLCGRCQCQNPHSKPVIKALSARKQI